MAYQSEIDRLQKQWMANPEQTFAPYAEALRKNGDLELALDVLQAGLAKRPTYLSAHIVLGRCLVDQKKGPEATKVFEHVLEMDAENIIALRFLSELTEGAGDIAGAQRWLKRLLDVDPMNDDAAEALKRVEAAAPPPAPEPAPEPESRPEEPAAAPEEPAQIAGFEATHMDAAPEAGVAADTSGANDFGIEQSSSPFDSNDGAKADMSALAMDNQELSFNEDGSVDGGTRLDLKEPEPEMVPSFDQAPPPPAGEPAAPDSFEPPMLALDEPPPPPPAPEPEPLAELEPVAAAPRASGPLSPASDLPLIMPDDLPPAPPPPPAPAPRASRAVPVGQPSSEVSEPEPVITETMAEVYLKQGLIAEAREVYRKLVKSRPGDAALREKLQSLEHHKTPPRGVPAVPAGGKPRFAASDTGGQSARSLFGQVLSSRPGTSAPEPPAPPPPPPSPARSSMSATAGTALEAAFADEPVQSAGAPTRPTSDELSLAAVFGEEPPPTPKSSAPSQASSTAATVPGGFSFDEFFGGKRADSPGATASQPAPSPAPTPTEPASADADGGSPDDFVAWLKGLKS